MPERALGRWRRDLRGTRTQQAPSVDKVRTWRTSWAHPTGVKPPTRPKSDEWSSAGTTGSEPRRNGSPVETRTACGGAGVRIGSPASALTISTGHLASVQKATRFAKEPGMTKPSRGVSRTPSGTLLAIASLPGWADDGVQIAIPAAANVNWSRPRPRIPLASRSHGTPSLGL